MFLSSMSWTVLLVVASDFWLTTPRLSFDQFDKYMSGLCFNMLNVSMSRVWSILIFALGFDHSGSKLRSCRQKYGMPDAAYIISQIINTYFILYINLYSASNVNNIIKKWI